MGVVDFLAEIEPAALRERVQEAVYQACSEVIATDPQLAPAAHLQRGRMSLARGDDDAAVQNFQAAVASQDASAVYYAARHLLRMGEGLATPLWNLRDDELDAYEARRESCCDWTPWRAQESLHRRNPRLDSLQLEVTIHRAPGRDPGVAA